jgi:hypothetical protein
MLLSIKAMKITKKMETTGEKVYYFLPSGTVLVFIFRLNIKRLKSKMLFSLGRERRDAFTLKIYVDINISWENQPNNKRKQ